MLLASASGEKNRKSPDQPILLALLGQNEILWVGLEWTAGRH
jgi:hypothetical protein